MSELLEGTFTTAGTTEETPFTIETMMEAKAKIDALGPDPLAELMRSKGADPKDGWLLLIPGPDFEKLDFGMFGPPNYMIGHPIISEPIMVNPKYLGYTF